MSGLFKLRKNKLALAPASVYLSAEWTCDGKQVPGRMLPATITHEGKVYKFDGVDRVGARYSLDEYPLS